MPPGKRRDGKTKASQSASGSAGPPCAICTNVVSTDAGDSPVTCSICKETCHRYCAGVSLTEYNSITDDTPYVCVFCFKVTTVKQISEMKNRIETLTSEIAELRKDRAPSPADEPQPASSQQPNPGSIGERRTRWSTVVRKHRSTNKRATGNLATQQPRQPRQPSQLPKKSSPPPRVQVVGARKVWGFTSEHAISTAVNKLTTLGDKEIKTIRRFRRYPGSKPRWWFVLKGGEDVLTDLERQWNEIELQTKWKLEPCLRLVDADTTDADDDSNQPPNQDAATTAPNSTPNPLTTTVSSNEESVSTDNSQQVNSDQDPDAGDPATNGD